MDQVCPVCRKGQSWSHLCLEQKDVVHLEQYRDYLQHSNPLDRLSHDDYIEVMWSDAGRLVLKRADDRMLEEEVLYFVNPLIYRVEIDPIATVLGFRGNLSGIAIEVDGHEDRHWDDVLQVLNGSTIPAVRFLRRRETHQCRLVSYNRTRLPYLWAVRMLGYIDGTGWTFLGQGAAQAPCPCLCISSKGKALDFASRVVLCRHPWIGPD